MYCTTHTTTLSKLIVYSAYSLKCLFVLFTFVFLLGHEIKIKEREKRNGTNITCPSARLENKRHSSVKNVWAAVFS